MRFTALLLVALALSGGSRSALAQTCSAEQASLTWNGGQPITNAYSGGLSADGRVMAWSTDANNVLASSNSSFFDVYVTELDTGLVERVSVDPSGGAGDNHSFNGDLSSDGRIVVFSSWANNLVAAPNLWPGVYARDRVTGTTERLDVTPAGVHGAGAARAVYTSGTGRFVVFHSDADDLVAGDSNGVRDVFVRDRAAGVTELVSLTSTGAPSTFDSSAHDISPDGRFVLLSTRAALVPGDTNGAIDVYVVDRAARRVTRASLGPGGVQSDASSLGNSVSPDGRFVGFASFATNFFSGTLNQQHAYVRDLQLVKTVMVDVAPPGQAGNAGSSGAWLSADGRYAVFASDASNLVPGDTNGRQDVFLRDLAAGATTMVSLTAWGAVPVAESAPLGASPLSADGRTVGFMSRSPNITNPPDPNGRQDVYARTCVPVGPETYCVAEANSLGCVPVVGFTGSPSAAAGSGFVVTSSDTLSNKVGLFFYGLDGARLVPFQGGLRCVDPPFRRTPLASSGGNPPPTDCSGELSLDFNAWIAGGADPALVPGQSVWGQWWSRDSGSSFDTNLGDAITFVIGP